MQMVLFIISRAALPSDRLVPQQACGITRSDSYQPDVISSPLCLIPHYTVSKFCYSNPQRGKQF